MSPCYLECSALCDAVYSVISDHIFMESLSADVEDSEQS
jgi:hypothetical protein